MARPDTRTNRREWIGIALLVAIGLIAPFLAYPTFVMKVWCFA
ncbi:MAG: branched-chain amino acid ABC transporter permease, partial [Betaproteobacteria bacterium]|nr:branched-chain amino acid ABC transporter permease [Betaproteobacteria bacterium]